MDSLAGDGSEWANSDARSAIGPLVISIGWLTQPNEPKEPKERPISSVLSVAPLAIVAAMAAVARAVAPWQ